jgi:NADPH:quinone reductase-like Zn-dependent oxidoreductase
MKGVVVAKPGGDFELTEAIERPQPGKKEVLVKSLVTGINPMENFMQKGLLVESWPIVLGCDASGIVVEVGADVTKFKVGDGIFGCTRLGFPGYMTFQEYFLMDDNLAFKRPKGITVEQAATIGVGALTACLGLITGTHLQLPEHPIEVDKGAEWVIILGGTSSVGQYSVQIAKLNGYRVLASCSPSNDKLLKSLGADATVDYKLSLQEQLEKIASITDKNFSRVFDASAQALSQGLEIITKVSTAKTKYYTSTNSWEPIEPTKEIEVYRINLGELGRASAKELNQEIEKFIPALESLLDKGYLKPIEYQCVGEGFESIQDGIHIMNTGNNGGKKVVVNLQDD